MWLAWYMQMFDLSGAYCLRRYNFPEESKQFYKILYVYSIMSNILYPAWNHSAYESPRCALSSILRFRVRVNSRINVVFPLRQKVGVFESCVYRVVLVREGRK